MRPSHVAEKLKKHRSFINRITSGDLKTLAHDDHEQLCKLLNIIYREEDERQELHNKTPLVDSSIMRLQDVCDDDPSKLKIVDQITMILESIQPKPKYELPWLDTPDLVAFGEEIMRAAHENPDKCGKVARIAMNWLADHYESKQD